MVIRAYDESYLTNAQNILGHARPSMVFKSGMDENIAAQTRPITAK